MINKRIVLTTKLTENIRRYARRRGLSTQGNVYELNDLCFSLRTVIAQSSSRCHLSRVDEGVRDVTKKQRWIWYLEFFQTVLCDESFSRKLCQTLTQMSDSHPHLHLALYNNSRQVLRRINATCKSFAVVECWHSSH